MVSAVAGLIKVRYLIDKAMIDNMVFRAHYRITSAILFVSCIIVTANNLIGKSRSSVKTNKLTVKISRLSNTMHQRSRCTGSRDQHLLLDQLYLHPAPRTR